MPKFRDTKYEDWTPPWGEGEFDAERAKKLIYDLRVDNEIQKERVAEVGTERDSIKTERDQLKNDIDSKAREGESEVDRLKRELADRDNKLVEAGKTSIETLKLRAALKAGLGEEHVNRLIGSTLEELEADAKTLKKSFGGTGKPDSEEKETPRGRPRPRRNPIDPDPGDDEMTVDQMIALAPSRSPF